MYIKNELSTLLSEKATAWNIVFQDPEDMIAAQDEAAGILANA